MKKEYAWGSVELTNDWFAVENGDERLDESCLDMTVRVAGRPQLDRVFTVALITSKDQSATPIIKDATLRIFEESRCSSTEVHIPDQVHLNLLYMDTYNFLTGATISGARLVLTQMLKSSLYYWLRSHPVVSCGKEAGDICDEVFLDQKPSA